VGIEHPGQNMIEFLFFHFSFPGHVVKNN
jgi:hypothetical protein